MLEEFDLSSEIQELMEKHLELVIEKNKVTNLTRIDDFESGRLLHLEDSLKGLQELLDTPKGDFADLGSGGGFPGIPLSLASGRPALLIDARRKKAEALEGIISELGLESTIDVYAGRAELFARTQDRRFSAVTARAVAKLSVLLELASPLLVKHGRLICYKARLSDDEIMHAKRCKEQTGLELVSDRSFTLSDGETLRRIVVFEKTSKPAMKLPRKEGAAQKNPI